jgi:hypothetical protein
MAVPVFDRDRDAVPVPAEDEAANDLLRDAAGADALGEPAVVAQGYGVVNQGGAARCQWRNTPQACSGEQSRASWSHYALWHEQGCQ